MEESKLHMFNLFYGHLQCLNNPQVLLTDTDSLLIKLEGPESDLSSIDTVMDYSNYPISHPKYNTLYKNKCGYLKDECKSKKVKEFVGVRSKCYSYVIIDGQVVITSSKCKGIPCVSKHISHSEFKEALCQIKPVYANFQNLRYIFFCLKLILIRSYNHQINMISIGKLAFSSFDDKRFIFKCGVHSVPYGSYHADKDVCPKCCVNTDDGIPVSVIPAN